MIPRVKLTFITFFLSTSIYGKFIQRNQGFSFDRFEQCGADVSDYEERCGDLISPPICGIDEACFTEDGCNYECINKTTCKRNLYFALLEGEKTLSNCAKEPSSRFFGTCDSINDENGHVTLPAINKIYEFDQRNITLLEGSRILEYQALLKDDQDFVNFFETSPCHGTLNNVDKTITFSNILNNENCLPECEIVVDGDTLYELCSVIIGYDDLAISYPGSSYPAVLQRGHSWIFTCKKEIQNMSEDPCSTWAKCTIDTEPVTDTHEIEEIDVKFNLDMHCCNPEEPDCFDDCKNEPVFQIGPNDDPNDRDLIVTMDFEHGSRDLLDQGYLHIMECTYEEFDRDDKLLVGPYEVIRDGCPTDFDDVSFLENLRERSLYSSYREIMNLKPFRVNKSNSIYFKFTCEVLKCSWDALDNNLCKLKDQCLLGDRYTPFYSYYTSIINDGSLQEINSGSVWIETITRSMKHPCSEINEEGDQYCVGELLGDQETDCWTFKLCKERSYLIEPSGNFAIKPVLTALTLFSLL